MMPIAPLPRESMMNHTEDGKKSDLQENDSSKELGHFERQAEVRFHPTPAEKAGGIHVAAEKAREAQQKYEEQLHRGDHKNEENIDKVGDELYGQGEIERNARQKAKDDAHKYNQMVNQQIHQKCYEAEKEASKMWKDARLESHDSRAIH
uniref:Uncharacterized protein n=1 Tax=Plectus sambesii TaxID=2011161 RepID=A0A914WG10_9BILA